ncbi:MAG: transposase [Campylobacterales bacterium]|nr:transposase [Campylobacterales bacterium]
MPRKPRIEIAGYYHILNRGVEQRVVFKESKDYEYFEELMCFYAKSYGITIHNYCLMSNHYHLLVEITQENLSKFMRQLNMNYSIYFNKKYKRSGHLWQGRFKSWYVTDEAYLYTLMCYIEQNPLKANMVSELKEYPYSSYHYFLNYKEIPECLENAWIVENYKEDKEAIKAFVTNPVDTGQLQELKRASSLVEAPNVDNKPKEEKLQALFEGIVDIKERNRQILIAIEKGYSQHMIAKVLGISQPAVYGVVKRSKK